MRTKFDVGQRVSVDGGPPIKVDSIRISDKGTFYLLDSGLMAAESSLDAAPSHPTIIIPRQSVIGDAMRMQGMTEWYVGNTSGEDIKSGDVFIMRLGQ